MSNVYKNAALIKFGHFQPSFYSFFDFSWWNILSRMHSEFVCGRN